MSKQSVEQAISALLSAERTIYVESGQEMTPPWTRYLSRRDDLATEARKSAAAADPNRKHRNRLDRFAMLAIQDRGAHAEFLEPCWHCGSTQPAISADGYPLEPWTIVCDCYDGAPDNPHRHDFARGATLLDAIDDWNERAEEA